MILPWQQNEWEQLVRLAKAARIPHALLFVGLSGMGKLHMAEQFARLLLCQQKTPFAEDCGTCHSCCLFVGKVHPNVMWITPEKEGHAIKVDQIRMLTDFINQSALQGEYRVIIIHPANNMNLNAANALLKTLEEPSANTILILIGDQTARLPATILSRCQRIIFKKPDASVALTWLQQELNDHTEKPALLLKIASGAPLAAKQLAEEEVLPTRLTLLQALCDLIHKQADPIKIAAKFQEIEILPFIDIALSFIMDVLQLQVGSEEITNQDYKTQLIEVKQTTRMEANVKWMEYLQQIRSKICLGLNVNKQLMMESVLIHWAVSPNH